MLPLFPAGKSKNLGTLGSSPKDQQATESEQCTHCSFPRLSHCVLMIQLVVCIGGLLVSSLTPPTAFEGLLLFYT